MTKNGSTAILFDLDGTLADTAPDLGAALNRLLQEQGREPVSYAQLRRHASRGGLGLIRFAFGESPDKETEARLVARFLKLYARGLCIKTRLFPGVENLLTQLSQRGIPWGIVTNKRSAFAEPLLQALGIGNGSVCRVYGDTTDHKKPHPQPLLHAAELLQLAPEQCFYVGDSERDVQAAKAAGMKAAIVTYGYEFDGSQPPNREIDAVLNNIADVMQHIDRRQAQ